MNVTPFSENSLWCLPRLTTTTSPARSVVVSSSIVISTSPSRTSITCSLSSCACHGTCLPGSYVTRQSSTWSPPIACRRTPSTNSHESRSFQVRKGEASGIDVQEAGAAVRGHGLHREVLVEEDPLPVALRLALGLDRGEHTLGVRGHLGHPDTDGVVNRVGNRRRLRVVRHLADRLRTERPVLGRVLDDHVVDLREVLHRGPEIRAELAAAKLGRRVVRIALLGQPEPKAHDRAALDLPFDERRVDRAADVIDLDELRDEDTSPPPALPPPTPTP